LVLVTVLPEDSSANLSFGEGLLLLVREVVELVFLEAGLGAFSTCLVFSLFYRRCCRGAANSIEKTAASLASWDWRYSMNYFSSTIDV